MGDREAAFTCWDIGRRRKRGSREFRVGFFWFRFFLFVCFVFFFFLFSVLLLVLVQAKSTVGPPHWNAWANKGNPELYQIYGFQKNRCVKRATLTDSILVEACFLAARFSDLSKCVWRVSSGASNLLFWELLPGWAVAWRNTVLSSFCHPWLLRLALMDSVLARNHRML